MSLHVQLHRTYFFLNIHQNFNDRSLPTGDVLSTELLSAAVKTVPLSQCNATFLNYNENKNFDEFKNGITDGQYCAKDPKMKVF